MNKLTPEQTLIMNVYVQTFVHIGKQYDSLEDALTNMPQEFWSKLDMPHRDKVERLLKEYFGSENG